MNQAISNPNDYKVVSFHNFTDFDFLPDMGCMYDGRVINGPLGGPGVKAGETMTLPYHIGHRLATNLAKMSLIRNSSGLPQKDAEGNPMIKSLWDDKGLENLKNSFITDLYSDDKPAQPSQTDILFEKVEALNKMVESLTGKKVEAPETPETSAMTTVYQDKAEVIAELDKRKVTYDKRKSKAELEKLLA